jgi:hypothetical protein
VVRIKRLSIHRVRLSELLEIGKHGAEKYQIIEPTRCRSDSAPLSEHRVQIDATCLIDCQQMPFDCVARSSHPRSTCEVVARIVKAMDR